MMLTSLFLISEARFFPSELGFQALLLSIYDMNIYLIPLFALFLASFSIYQEKELKTNMILLTKKESYFSFLWNKTIAIQLVIISTFFIAYLILAIFMKVFVGFEFYSFLVFILVLGILLLIFNQIGIFLGSIARSKMQLVSANILIWFFLIFLLGLVFLYVLPAVDYHNVTLFAWFYFLDPLHTLRFLLEVELGLFSLINLSHLVRDFVMMSPWLLLLMNLLIWPGLFFLFALFSRRIGDRHD
ncbi:ABC transporter permease subunit [Oceanobacillus alkalisoli]|uniref:ABC transporter permease subunit n=1 Tax=Oceanobacillus alkalisoli TaxID=2925113 RepID=UPI001EE43916|nr:ABC transporter permease subunit [Oceanobacillus alkalisoli]MCG5102158.1 ABC transporter permease [Oceanobacillus alkalisoli]